MSRMLAAAIVMAMAPAMARAEVACPPTNGGAGLRRPTVGTLYLGDPAQLESQAPDRTTGAGGSFVNTFGVPNSQQYTLVCHYQRGRDLILRLPAGLRSCTQSASAFACR